MPQLRWQKSRWLIFVLSNSSLIVLTHGSNRRLELLYAPFGAFDHFQDIHLPGRGVCTPWRFFGRGRRNNWRFFNTCALVRRGGPDFQALLITAFRQTER